MQNYDIKNSRNKNIKKISATFVAIIMMLTVFSAMTLTVTSEDAFEPFIWTDKDDYSPDETVVISGSGLIGDTLYDIPVIRPDGTIATGDGTFTHGWDTFETDTDGKFTYNYKLDGIEGLYEV